MPSFQVAYLGSNEVPVHLIQPILDEIGAQLTISNPQTEEEVAEAGRDADAMILHGSVPITRDVLFALRRCKAICRTGVGVDRMDLEAAAERDIVISNAAGCNSIEVAEQTIGLLITLQRKLYRMDQYVRAGRWGRHSAELHAYRGPVHRIAGQTLGIVGLGHVGQQVAPRAQGLGLRVQATDPFLAPDVAARFNVPLVPLDELIRTSDFVSLHAPLYGDTRHMIDAERLAQFKPGAYLINCGRGPLVDTNALMDALRSGQIAGAALDVTEPEPLPGDHPLLTLDNVIVTAHTGANSDESYEDCQTHAAREVVRVLRGEPPLTPVNDPWLVGEQVETGFGGV
jgi:D-3-phosphoglycerate dehydrogenase / 2-oxoglutarate reductase